MTATLTDPLWYGTVEIFTGQVFVFFHLQVFMGSAIISCIVKSLYYFAMCANNANLFHKKMLKRVMTAPMRFFDLNPIGKLTECHRKCYAQNP